MTTSKPRANCVLSIKTDKRYSVRQAAYSGASAAPFVGLVCFCASCGGVYCRFCGLTSSAGRSSLVKNRASVPHLINAFLALDFWPFTYLDN